MFILRNHQRDPEGISHSDISSIISSTLTWNSIKSIHYISYPYKSIISHCCCISIHIYTILYLCLMIPSQWREIICQKLFGILEEFHQPCPPGSAWLVSHSVYRNDSLAACELYATCVLIVVFNHWCTLLPKHVNIEVGQSQSQMRHTPCVFLSGLLYIHQNDHMAIWINIKSY